MPCGRVASFGRQRSSETVGFQRPAFSGTAFLHGETLPRFPDPLSAAMHSFFSFMEKIELRIEGMHCGACAAGIQMLVSQMDGVKSVFVDYAGKKGTVEFEADKVKKEDIIKAIAELGYQAS